MQLHELKPTHKKTDAKRVGRGGKRGKTSGRGHKGQKARAGNSTRPEMRDFIKKIPKLRGFGVNRADTVNAERDLPTVVNLSMLEAKHEAGDVTPGTIVASGIIDTKRKKVPKIKVLGDGEITKKFNLSGCQISKSAKEKIEAAGGSVA